MGYFSPPLSHFPGFIRHYYDGLPRKNVTAGKAGKSLKLLEAEKLLLIKMENNLPTKRTRRSTPPRCNYLPDL